MMRMVDWSNRSI